jgi:phosphomevalonate kinase
MNQAIKLTDEQKKMIEEQKEILEKLNTLQDAMNELAPELKTSLEKLASSGLYVNGSQYYIIIINNAFCNPKILEALRNGEDPKLEDAACVEAYDVPNFMTETEVLKKTVMEQTHMMAMNSLKPLHAIHSQEEADEKARLINMILKTPSGEMQKVMDCQKILERTDV